MLSSNDDVVSTFVKKHFKLPIIFNYKKKKVLKEGDKKITNVQRYKPYYKALKEIMFPDLMNLFAYFKDDDLENEIIDFIYKCFTQRRRFIKSLTNVVLLTNERETGMYTLLHDKVKDFKTLCENSEQWFYLTTSKDNSKELEQVQADLILFIRCLSPAAYVTPDGKVEEGEQLSAYFKDIKVSYERQQVLCNLNFHTVLINLLKDGDHVLKEIKTINSDNQQYVMIFKLVFQFLATFCSANNKRNKKLLSKEIDFFISQLNSIELGQIELLTEMYRNNYQLVKNFDLSVLESILNIIATNGCNPKYYDFLKVLIECNGEPIKDNQIRVLEKILSHKHKDKILNLEFSPQYNHEIFSFNRSELREGEYLYMYTARVIEFLTIYSRNESQDSVLNFMCRKILPYDYVLDLLSLPDIFSYKLIKFDPERHLKTCIVKIPLLAFFTGVWLRDQKLFQDLVLDVKPLTALLIFERDKLENLQTKDFENIALGSFEDFTEEYNEEFNVYVADNRVDYLNYFLKGLYPMLLAIKEKLIQGDVLNVIDERHIKFQKAFQSLLNTLELNYPKFIKFVREEEAFDELINAFRQLGVVVDAVAVKQYMNSENSDSEEEKKEIPIETAEKPQTTAEPQKIFFDYTSMKTFLPTIPPNSTVRDERQSIWRNFILTILSNTSIREKVQKESRNIAWMFQNVESVELEPGKSVAKFAVISKRLLNLMEKNANHPTPKVKQINRIGELLTAIFKFSNPEDKRKLQYIFHKNAAAQHILSIMCAPQLDPSNFKCMLELSVEYLNGGFLEGQNAFYEFFVSNPESEVIFERLYKMIDNEVALHENELSYTEYIDRILEEAPLSHRKPKFEFSTLLNFLQLLTENHNSRLQDYLRRQTNSRTSYDLVDACINLCRSLIKRLTPVNYETLQRCMATLAEFIQGPCLTNQQVLVDKKFIETGCSIMNKCLYDGDVIMEMYTGHQIARMKERYNTVNSIFINQLHHVSPVCAKKIEESHKRLSPLHFQKWMLNRLKYKTVIILESLLEGQNDGKTLKIMTQECPASVLLQNLKIIFKNQHNYYGRKMNAESLNHFEIDPNSLKDKDDTLALELIIETGFKIYGLLSIYAESKLEGEDINAFREALENYSSNERSIVNEREGLIREVFFFVWDIIKFLFTIYKVILLAVSRRNVSTLRHASIKQISLTSRHLVPRMIKFFSRFSASIEIIRDDNIEKTFFFLVPHCTFITDTIRKRVRKGLSLRDPTTKVRCLMSQFNEMNFLLKHEQSLYHKTRESFWLRIILRNGKFWRDVAFLISVFQNYHFFQNLRYFDDAGEIHYGQCLNAKGSASTWAITLQMVAVILMLLTEIISKGPIIFHDSWIDQFDPYDTVFQRVVKTIKNFCRGIWRIVSDFKLLYTMIYTSIAIVAGSFALNGSGDCVQAILNGFLLVDVIVRYPTLQNFLKSIWKPKVQIFFALLLFVLLEYLFTMIGYYFIRGDLQQLQEACPNFKKCFLSIFDLGFKYTGGVGAGMPDWISKIDCKAPYI